MNIEDFSSLDFKGLSMQEIKRVEAGTAPLDAKVAHSLLCKFMKGRGIDSEAADLGELPKDFRWQIRSVGGSPDDPLQLVGRFRFDGYERCGHFALLIFVIARQSYYYPDITFGDGYVFVYLSTLKVQGLHANDLIMMARIDDLLDIPDQ